jgi:diguanylate cyclase (GGDEF)-like protein/PAS domain S-box-containing protein
MTSELFDSGTDAVRRPWWWRWWCAPLGAEDLQVRLDSVPAASWTTVFVSGPVALYAILARPRPEAIALSALAALAVVGSLAVLRLPWERFARSPWREAYYAAWWLTDFGLIVTATVLGGGPRSPLLLLAFIQLVFTSLSYPRASVVIAIGLTIMTVIVLAAVYHEPLSLALIQVTAFAGTGLMVYLQTRNHDRRARALEASERRLAEAQQIAHIGSWEWRADSGRIVVSDEVRRIFGTSAGDGPATIEDYVDRVHPSDRDDLEQHLRDAITADGSFSLEHRVVHDDGSIHSVLVHGTTTTSDGAIVQICGVSQDITELRRIEASLRHHADHDPLTGLLSRRRLVAEIDRQLSRGSRCLRSGALLLIELDGFGFYNDSYGQMAGDALLRSIADSLVHRLRATDIIARSGGDEFGVVLEDSSSAGALETAHELRLLIADCGGESPITASIGIATFGPGSELVGDNVLVAADIALHEAKRNGGNRVISYSGQNGPDMTWMEHIRRALEGDLFVLHAQPIIELASGKVSHHELLIRMRDDDDNLIMPDAFLPTAERFGLINAIDRWVTRAAVSLVEDGHHVALNLSANSIGDAELIRMVRAAAEHGLDPSMLIFEVTETAAIANLQEAREFASTLAGIGCQLAIDDFGTGFGSLTYLKHIPSEYVKIDREFIKELTRSATDQHVVRAVVGIAQSLGKRTVAEGVEAAATLALVRRLGVDYVQGYHTGRPQQLWPTPVAKAASEIAA